MPPQDPESARWFAEHLLVHEPMLRAWLEGRFPGLPGPDRDDILQEAYTRVLQARTSQKLRSPKAFLFTVARNLAFDVYRKLSATRSVPLGDVDDLDVLEDGTDTAATVSRHQEIELMTQAIQALPDRCRQVMTLRYVYGLGHREIAAELGIAQNTVEVQITAGIKRCTQYFRDRGLA